MTYAAFGIHRQLVEEEGYDPTSDDYYAELDSRIKNDFPSKFQPKKKPQQRVAAASNSASRTTTKGGKKVITLTDSQKAIARKLNVLAMSMQKKLQNYRRIHNMTEKRIPRESQTRKKKRDAHLGNLLVCGGSRTPEGICPSLGSSWDRSEDDKTNVHAKLREG